MAELVYAFDLKSNGEIHMGSSPISGTSLLKLRSLSDFFTYFFDLPISQIPLYFYFDYVKIRSICSYQKTKK